MPKLKHRTPSYCLHKPSGQAVVTLDSRTFYLGRHGTKASLAEYDRLVGTWQGNGRRLPPERDEPAVLVVSEVIAAYWQHAQTYYCSPDGSPSKEQQHVKLALRPVRRLYGPTPAAEFGPMKLKIVRQTFIDAGASRRHTNQQVGRIKRLFKWCVENELVPLGVYHGLQAVAGLKRGRTAAPDAAPIRAVADELIDAVRPYLSRQVWAMVELQRITGMRSGEVVVMRGCDIDMTGDLWEYRPERHKTQHHGHERVVMLGSRAQVILRSFLKADLQASLFSPADAETERRDRVHAARSTSMSCGNRPGTNRRQKPKRKPRGCYDADSYRRAITRACKLVGIPHWHPHQLGHAAATTVRKAMGLEAAQVWLGHAKADVTQLYAERNLGLARKIAAKFG